MHIVSDGYITFPDVFLYLPELNAGVGTCGNLSNDANSYVNFSDTVILLPHLAGRHECP